MRTLWMLSHWEWTIDITSQLQGEASYWPCTSCLSEGRTPLAEGVSYAGKPELRLLDPHGMCSIQSLSRVQLFATPWTVACQVSLCITNSWSLLRLMSIELVMPSNHLILCCPLLLPLQSFPASVSFLMSHSSLQVAKVLQFQLQHQSFQWTFRTDFL